MKIISLFNNKGGVGKSTLAFHLSNVLADMGHRTLVIDLDPQCNLTICGIEEEQLHTIWQEEDDFIEDYESKRKSLSGDEFDRILGSSRTIHFLLKPTEDGQGELPTLPPPIMLKQGLDMIPGRLTIHRFEGKISERWSGAYSGDPLAIRTITRIRELAELYGKTYGYEYIIIDTSPSLGALNKVIISTVDGFIIPALPDMFSMYGIRNIGSALSTWKKEFDTIYKLISEDKRKKFPVDFVKFLGYTIYNAKKRTGMNPWNLATAHYNYARQIPETIDNYITEDVMAHIGKEMAHEPIGGTSVMHSHNTLPNMTQKYKKPIWEVPTLATLEAEDIPTISGNRKYYEETKARYMEFAADLIDRISKLD